MSAGEQAAAYRQMVERVFESDVLPALSDYTRLHCLSPAFDPGWEGHGEIHRAAELLAQWSRDRPLAGLAAEVRELPGRTPVLVVDVPGTGADGNVLVYGHLDKQPPQGDWRPGLGPFEPVRQGERLYGRGTADDGYSNSSSA